MRPIKLKLSGLNSFRQPQEIDFDRLCETGVFGIFGPTGSGKSTILDAITLALYGTVERAANNTQGILNHAEDGLSVQFTFALGTGERRKVYRAERSYRRSGDSGVRAGICRLIDISEGESVLATGPAEMGKAVLKILGLTVEDFTRAVVLPQGKFAEFLVLKPSERRNMLERLFGLQAYGRELTARLQGETSETEKALHGVTERQLGLGDASAERVREAEEELAGAIAAADGVVKVLAETRRKFEEAKEVWNLQEQLKQTEGKAGELSAKHPLIKQLQDKLALAERAETVRPLLAAESQAANDLEGTLVRAEQAGMKLKLAEQAVQGAEEQWSRASEQRKQGEPRLLALIQQLKTAQGLELEIKQYQEELQSITTSTRQESQQKAAIEQKLAVIEAKKTECLEQHEQLKLRIAQISVSPAQRHRLNEAVQALTELRLVDEELQRLQGELELESARQNGLQTKQGQAVRENQVLKTKLDTVSGQLTAMEQEAPAGEDVLGTSALEIERFSVLIDNIARAEAEWQAETQRQGEYEAECEQLKATVKVLAAQYETSLNTYNEAVTNSTIQEQKVRELERINLAGVLAQDLREGTACPVCGSLHHLHVIQRLDQGKLDLAKEELARGQEFVQRLDQKRTAAATQLATSQANQTSAQAKLATQISLAEEKQKTITAYRRLLPAEERTLSTAELRTNGQALTEQLRQKRNDLKVWKTAKDGLTAELEAARTALTEGEKEHTRLQAEAAAVDKTLQDLQRRLAEGQSKQAAKRLKLDAARENIAINEISVRQRLYATWDEEHAALTERLAELEQGIKGLDKSREELNQRLTHHSLSLAGLQSAECEKAKTINNLQTKLISLTGSKPATELLMKAEQERNQLAEREERLNEAMALSKKQAVEAERFFVQANKEREVKQEGLDNARGILDKSLHTAGFQTASAAEAGLCDVTERAEMGQTINHFNQEQLLLRQRQQVLTDELAGRVITPEEWEAWPERLDRVVKDQTTAAERRGAAERMAELVKNRHMEWQRLEDKRQALARRDELLRTLQSVFKGNAFVEFIAEEQLTTVALSASERLGQLTNHRYALEVDSNGGFVIRDDHNGGIRRPVSTLSGGETFLTSLALALALSTQIQLRGEYPLEFFFLDEGFGTLDQELLEVVMGTLERLRLQNITIGIISHVPELRNRLARRLIVSPAEAGGRGSSVRLELA
ncbi:MAG TPA: AAA family ATPase [Desulfobacteria bacterium]|nr:AAA family ATPase [Desulfobacteria bacterium]